MAANAIIASSRYDANSASGYATVLVQGANATFQITANSTGGNSTIGSPAAGDFIKGATVSGLWWSTDGTVTVLRGSNVVATLNGSDHWSASNGWRGLNLYKDATLVVNVSSANATVYVELKKVYR